jgi:hypothetical protein
VEVHPAARRRGIADEDIEHAVANAMTIDDQDDDTRLYLGPARDADLLEVVTIVRATGDELDPSDANAPQIPAAAAQRLTMAKTTHGKTRSGKPIDDDLVSRLAEQAEAGYDIDKTLKRRKGGRPPLGSGPASVESVRLEPELRDALAKRAERDHETTSTVIRKALRRYLGAS